MLPNYYFDVNTKTQQNVEIGLQLVHNFYAKNESYHPIALPAYQSANAFSTFRVFGQDDTTLNQLKSYLNIHNMENIGSINVVPSNITTFVAFQKWNIPSRKADRNGGRLRWKRMQEADVHMIYVNCRSKSNKTTFRRYINIIESNTKSIGNCHPNSYGLSKPSAPFNLPHF